MKLAEIQSAVMALILDDAAQTPLEWNERQRAGIDIYRNAYRVRLVDSLAEVFERTREWVGEESFRRAAAHHLIVRAPCSWTIDRAGEGFVDTLGDLFSRDPEVPELAWLEWAMHSAFVAADCVPLSPGGFAAATALPAEAAWAGLRLRLVPGLEARAIAFDCGGLWRALAKSENLPKTLELPESRGLVVWREAMTPVFMSVDAVEHECLQLVAASATYGDVCDLLVDRFGEAQAITYAGVMLGRWLSNGWIAGLDMPDG